MRVKALLLLVVMALTVMGKGIVLAGTDNKHYPVKIKMLRKAKKPKKGEIVPLARVVNDVKDEEGNILIEEGSTVYGTLRKDKKNGLIYFEFLYVSDKKNKRIPVRGYIVKQIRTYSVGQRIGQYLLGIVVFPLLPFLISSEVKRVTQKGKFIKTVLSSEIELWITTN